MSEQPKIHAEMILLRNHIGGLEAKKTAGGAAFPVKSAKDLSVKLRTALDKLGMNCYPVAHEVTLIDVDKGSACFVKLTLRIVATDGSFVDLSGIGHGMDRDDKAGGKASTYAWKDALVKGLSLPDAELRDTDDESGHGATMKVKAVPVSGAFDALITALRAAKSEAEVIPLTAQANAMKLDPAQKVTFLSCRSTVREGF